MVKKSVLDSVFGNAKEVGYIFLGVGLLIYVMNLATFMTFVQTQVYPYTAFNVSVFASVLVILYSVYLIEEN